MSSSQNVQLDDELEGGYDYEFVDGPPCVEYTCLLCSLVAREARQANCCGKLFCRQCLENSTGAKAICPFCHEHLNFMYFEDTRVIGNINQLNVYCRNKQQGCTWEGELCHVEAHHDTCPHRQIQCPNQCGAAIGNVNLQEHLETECPNRQIECGHCGQVGKHAHITADHLEDCLDLQIECPNEGCQVKPKRKNMESHRQQCLKETVSCQYAKLGCEHVCLREDIGNHIEREVQVHLQLATNELANLRTLLENQIGAPKRHVFKMANFTKLKHKKECWSSQPFYAFPGGYKVCLKVYVGGEGAGKGTHISAYLFLVAGENDETLEWPLRGTFSIELLNQKEDQNHKQRSICLKDTTAQGWNSKVSKDCSSSGVGCPKFMKYEELEGDSLPSQTQYLKEDTLYFRVSMTERISTSKSWLAVGIDS